MKSKDPLIWCIIKIIFRWNLKRCEILRRKLVHSHTNSFQRMRHDRLTAVMELPLITFPLQLMCYWLLLFSAVALSSNTFLIHRWEFVNLHLQQISIITALKKRNGVLQPNWQSNGEFGFLHCSHSFFSQIGEN